jgi:hypothetical protein
MYHGLTLKDLFDFFIVTVVFKYIIARWIAEKLRSMFISFFIRTKHDLMLYVHYRDKHLK